MKNGRTLAGRRSLAPPSVHQAARRSPLPFHRHTRILLLLDPHTTSTGHFSPAANPPTSPLPDPSSTARRARARPARERERETPPSSQPPSALARPMAAAAAELSADLARKAHLDALNRDYVVEPHLGECHGLESAQPELPLFSSRPSLTPAPRPRDTHTHPHPPHPEPTHHRVPHGRRRLGPARRRRLREEVSALCSSRSRASAERGFAPRRARARASSSPPPSSSTPPKQSRPRPKQPNQTWRPKTPKGPSSPRSSRCASATAPTAAGRSSRSTAAAPSCKFSRAPRASTTARPPWSSRARCSRPPSRGTCWDGCSTDRAGPSTGGPRCWPRPSWTSRGPRSTRASAPTPRR